MKNFIYVLSIICSLLYISCEDYSGPIDPEIGKKIELQNHSVTTTQVLKKMSGFEDVEIYNLLTSEDTYLTDFVYGSMADGAGLLRNGDGTFTLINNIEADYSVARITLDETFKPIKGEYILNAEATAETAQCSGSMITPKEHGFGPLYLSGGEWGGNSKGVFVTYPYKKATNAGTARMLTAMGQWSTENAVVIGKNAYKNKTVVFIGDDQSDNEIPSGQLAMYVGHRGDLLHGKLYGLKVNTEGITYEMDMEEGISYDAEFVELTEKNIDLLDAEAKAKGVMGFSRVEDIDWRRGSSEKNREVYFAVTGRDKPGLVGKGTRSGRIYKVVLDANDPTIATITCVLDGDKENGKAQEFHSPDNILVTENYAYIQEDPNGIADFKPAADHYARVYQYDLNTGALKAVLECDQITAAASGYGSLDKTWELTGMIDISDIIGVDETFLLMTQNHGWEKEDGTPFTDPNANPNVTESRKEGSMLYVIKGLER